MKLLVFEIRIGSSLLYKLYKKLNSLTDNLINSFFDRKKLSMSNTVRDKECDYGTYANEKRLSDAGIRCTRPGTESVDLNGIAIAVCKEHFEKINS